MEVDPPASTASTVGTLKRSNSAPMINILGTDSSSSPIPNVSTGPLSPTLHAFRSLSPSFRPLDSHRQRRYSASSTNLHATASAPVRIPSRLHQIKHEESMHVANREAAHEKEVQSAMIMSQSWDELTLDDTMHIDAPAKRPRSFSETLNPLHVFTSGFPVTASSPSPNRLGSKQCFSPSLQQPVISAFSPSPSPSPTRKTFPRRSLSPIVALKPSSFGPLTGKRKLDTDSDRFENYFSPPKRFMNSISTPEKPLLPPHPLTQSLSSTSFDSSPEQLVPTTHAITSSSSSSSCYTFTPVQVPHYSHHSSHHSSHNDSESSDMTEMTDTSESSEVQPMTTSSPTLQTFTTQTAHNVLT